MPVPDWGEAGGTCPHPPRRGRGECPKKNLRIYMYGNGLVVFGVFWSGLGYFEAVGFQKRNLAHYMYGDALVGFGMVLGGYGCFNGPHDRAVAAYLKVVRRRKSSSADGTRGWRYERGLPLSLGGLGVSPEKILNF